MITSGITYSFKRELFEGIHDFGEDMFGIALYHPSANLSPVETTEYTEDGEIVDADYETGGVVIMADIVERDGSIVIEFEDVEFTGQMKAKGAMIFNISKDMRSIAILDFGSMVSSVDGAFRVTFPKGENAPYGLLNLA